MKQKIVLLFVMTLFIGALRAQKAQKITGYAITPAEKGQRGWKEVRLMDITTGEELKTIYRSTDEIEALNARTGKPVIKKEISIGPSHARRAINLDQELNKTEPVRLMQAYTHDGNNHLQPMKVDANGKVIEIPQKDGNNRVIGLRVYSNESQKVQSDKPFATSSAAMAYDKKHERLYYTPMSISQLRYIDLKSKTPKIYFFEDEPFGTVGGPWDTPNQITRMVIASDGNGYGLTNDGNHLIRFTTGKKPVITDLGPITDDRANGKFSIHSPGGFGGDMIADASGNLYLVTANRNVFKIGIESKVAIYKGTITGLPKGFTTNGTMVEEGTKIIIASSESTAGYFRFDLNTMQAEKVSAQGEVFNASDLANGILAFEKKKKEKKDETVKEEIKPEATEIATRKDPISEIKGSKGIVVYPNPVSNGMLKLSFADQPAGKYQVQLMDMSGKLISAQEVNISNKVQVEEFILPALIGKGNYLLRIANENNKISVINKIMVQ